MCRIYNKTLETDSISNVCFPLDVFSNRGKKPAVFNNSAEGKLKSDWVVPWWWPTRCTRTPSMAQDWQVVWEALVTYHVVHSLSTSCLQFRKTMGCVAQSNHRRAVLEPRSSCGVVTHVLKGWLLACIESGCMNRNMLWT